jgi:hypothetical protein
LVPFGLPFNLKDGDSKFLQNFGKPMPDSMTSYSRRQYFSGVMYHDRSQKIILSNIDFLYTNYMSNSRFCGGGERDHNKVRLNVMSPISRG